MATELKASVNVDVGGFKQGMQEAADSTKAFEREIEEINASTFPKLRKEMAKAKNDAKNLGMAYSQLSDEAKQSKFGQELKRQFDEAVQSAAQLRDLNSDIDEKIKNLSSDTLALDIVSDSFDVVANSVTGVIGTIGTLTGNSEDAQRAMSALAASTGLVNAATKVTNMLQPQSNLLIGIGALQAKAKAKADELAAAATGKATIAQKAFNAVAKANPYVLLAAGVVALTAAIGAFIIATHKSEEAQKREKLATEAQEEALKAYESKLTSAATDTISKYKALQAEWNNLKSAHEKNEFIKKNKDELKNYSDQCDNATQVDKIFNEQAEDVVKGLMAKAKAAAKAAQAQVLYQKAVQASIEVERIQAQMQADIAKGRQKITRTVAGSGGQFGNVQTYTYMESETEMMERINKKYGEELKQWQDQQKEFNAQGDKLIKEAVDEGYHVNDSSKAINNNTKSLKSNSKAIDYTVDSLAALKAELSVLQERRSKGLLPQLSAEEYINKVNSIKEQIEEKEIKLGINQTSMEGSVAWFNKKISALSDKQVNLAINSPEWNKIQGEIDDLTNRKHQAEINVLVTGSLPYYEAKIDELKKKQIKLAIGSDDWKNLQKEIDDVTREQREVTVKANLDQFREDLRKSINQALTVEAQPDFDFSFLPEKTQKEADQLKTQTDQIYNEMKRLKELMSDKNAAPTEIEEWTRAYKELEAQLTKNTAKLKEFNAESKKKKDDNKKNEERVQTWQDLSHTINQAGEAMGALGDAFESPALNIAGVIAQAIASISLGFADALAKDQTTKTNIFAFIGASISAVATLAALVSQIKSISAYAEGGVIGGNSYTGDKLLARVNSGETILNEKQQQRALDLMDANSSGGSQRVVGVIKGTDILLVAKNTNKKLAKSGTNISFG